VTADIAPLPEIGILLEYADRFRDQCPMRVCQNSDAYEIRVLELEDSAGLTQTLREVAERLAGLDWADNNSEFLEACAGAGLDYDTLIQLPGPLSPEQEEDLRRKELGDLGELLTTFAVLAHYSFEPALVFAKNVLKLYERVSEPGVDVIGLSMDMASDERTRLVPGEAVSLIETKASENRDLQHLASEAANSLDDIDLHKLQRELRLIRASLEARGAAEAAERLPFFLLEFVDPAGAVRMMAFLACPESPSEPVRFGGLAELGQKHALTAAIAVVETGPLRQEVLRFRRGAASE
jgi:hypothetical protein